MRLLSTYFMHFHSGLHLGLEGIDGEDSATHLPSDTLFSALLDEWRRSGGDVSAFVKPFCAANTTPTTATHCAAAGIDLPFLLSSAFPFAGAVRFFPMPVDLSRLFSAPVLADRGKSVKRIRYLSEGLFQRAQQGELLDDLLFAADEDGQPAAGLAVQGGALWMLRDEIGGLPPGMCDDPAKAYALRHRPIYTVARVPRVTVTRIHSASTIYYVGRSSFAPGCGLWFGVDWRQPDAEVDPGVSYRSTVEELLARLGDAGIGGERSAGYGAFHWTLGAPLAAADCQPDALGWLLSRYHPHASELPGALIADGAGYALVNVGGWLFSPGEAAQRRKRLAFVAEGSLIRPPAHPAGSICDVRPTYAAAQFPHPVYRYGFALTVGMPAQGGR